MSAESENFRQLRRLLALKRYEQPPPGFFNGFSRQVIVRIEAGERGDNSLIEQIQGRASWLLRLWNSFGAKPILAGAFGVTVCSVLIAGVAYSDRKDSGSPPALAASSREQAGLVQVGAAAVGGLLQPGSANGLSGTGSVPTLEERTSLFQEVHAPPRPQLIMDVVAPGPRN